MIDNGFYYDTNGKSFFVYSGKMYAVITNRHWTWGNFEWAEMRSGFWGWLFSKFGK